MFEKKSPRNKITGVRFTEAENEKLEKASKNSGLSKSDFIREAILEKLKEIEK